MSPCDSRPLPKLQISLPQTRCLSARRGTKENGTGPHRWLQKRENAAGVAQNGVARNGESRFAHEPGSTQKAHETPFLRLTLSNLFYVGHRLVSSREPLDCLFKMHVKRVPSQWSSSIDYIQMGQQSAWMSLRRSEPAWRPPTSPSRPFPSPAISLTLPLVGPAKWGRNITPKGAAFTPSGAIVACRDEVRWAFAELFALRSNGQKVCLISAGNKIPHRLVLFQKI